MRGSRCQRCGRKLHNAGNFPLMHTEMTHVLMRRMARRSKTWRLVLLAVIIVAIVHARK